MPVTVRVEPDVLARDLVADVVRRLVGGLDAEQLGEDRLRRRQVGGRVDDGLESVRHRVLLVTGYVTGFRAVISMTVHTRRM